MTSAQLFLVLDAIAATCWGTFVAPACKVRPVCLRCMREAKAAVRASCDVAGSGWRQGSRRAGACARRTLRQLRFQRRTILLRIRDGALQQLVLLPQHINGRAFGLASHCMCTCAISLRALQSVGCRRNDEKVQPGKLAAGTPEDETLRVLPDNVLWVNMPCPLSAWNRDRCSKWQHTLTSQHACARRSR